MSDDQKKAYIFGAILTLANRLQILGDKLDENVTMKQWLLIAIILKCGNPSPTLSEVAEMIGNSRQNVKKMALILEKQGFVSLTKDVHDARVVRIHLTPKCTTYFQERGDKEEQFMDALFDAFDEEVTNGLYKGLIQLADNIAKMEEGHDNAERS
ncbi:MarR family transcriptional regulator [Paenibacillus thiaminolyticus]|uniref:MarR family transcriptional regulator n=1 Tax=Paenibacillus thiaminolyticus TaxID=49283 RepID=A0AAP9DST0_PANTH|nr:MarR family transcriptional regulator [Paenibacillus thiaminolyticus]MCY9535460.1 MarR family transcriptional regulator [Paenibacillus thiaminolyticus]MCY9602189.1 MarR family transcriptional regulator [Paenibacillus thiaminolyticus]MCY9605951.1 MarR family transcriptional regulator [Paenibacillus thiaminolyticus]MCY9612358.1 MarR family transcriptional regulator [Paenibacillus thiaminolyticus]MCY9619353.1 MarR family transcriptional regulator [Paenibacillus thiaminolyticus]